MCVGATPPLRVYHDATFAGVDLCQTFNYTPDDIYYKWESIILTQHTMGMRYIDSNTPGTIKTFIQLELAKTLAQGVKVESSLRKTKNSPAAAMLGLGSRMNLPSVGLVDTAPTRQSSSAMSRGVGKMETSMITFECHDIEDLSLSKRNCTRHSASRQHLISQ